jgi:hypothetical protein
VIEVYGSSEAKPYKYYSYEVCCIKYIGATYVRIGDIKVAGVRFEVIVPPTKIDTFYYDYRCYALATIILEQKVL